MRFLNFEAVVEVDGVALPEYEVKYDDKANSATCWIPSEAGKPFAIAFQPLKKHSFATSGRSYVDGKYVGGKFNRSRSCIRLVKMEVRTSATTARPLQFSTIQFTDDEASTNFPPTKSLGNIVVKMYHVELGKSSTHDGVRGDFSDHKVSESSKKAMAHQVKFGGETYVERGNSRHTKDISQLVHFTFKYRSIDTLRADGIAPPDPAVRDHSKGKRKAAELDVKEEKASDDDAEESDSDEEENTIFKGLLDALHKLEEKRAKKKAAKAKSQSTSSKKIKTEPKARPLRASVTEVIDLT